MLKFLTFLAIACLALLIFPWQQVPVEVQNAFRGRYPDASKLRWEKEKDELWEGEFILNNVEYSALFLVDGTWLETEFEIGRDEVPKEILGVLNELYTEFELEESEKLDTPRGTVYEFELEKGSEEIKIRIDAEGNLLGSGHGHADDDK